MQGLPAAPAYLSTEFEGERNVLLPPFELGSRPVQLDLAGDEEESLLIGAPEVQ